MASLLARARHKYLPPLIRPLLRVRPRPDVERLGGRYGGWLIPTSALSRASICYCVGVGEDITFDLALIDRFGCDVWAADPTPRAVAHVAKTAAADLRYRDKYHFRPVGLWSSDTTLRFFAPANPSHVSHSLTNLHGGSAFIEVPVRALTTLMRDSGHDRIDLLKIDVEGAEYEVLGQLIASGVRPTVLCVEFDQPAPVRQTLAMARRLRDEAAYDVVAQDGWNVTFLQRTAT